MFFLFYFLLRMNPLFLPGRERPRTELQWATKVLRQLAVKFDFRASWKHFTPSPPPLPNNAFLLFPRQHRLRGLHNIELEGRGYQRIDARYK